MHHRFSDRPGDPHSPWRYGKSVLGLTRGMVYAHVGWIIDSVHADEQEYAPDLLADSAIVRACRLYPAWVAGSVLLPQLAGGGRLPETSGRRQRHARRDRHGLARAR